MRHRRARNAPRLAARGFTLVELMIVVVIVGILAAVAGPMYFKHRRRSVALETSEVLTQIVHAQEGYRAEFNTYSDVSNDFTLSAPSTNGNRGSLGQWWPSTAGTERTQVDFYASLPAAWNQLGVRPRQLVRYQYQTIAGNPGITPAVGAPSGNLGYGALPTAQQGQWYFATARGDLDADGIQSRFEVSSLTRELRVIGEETE